MIPAHRAAVLSISVAAVGFASASAANAADTVKLRPRFDPAPIYVEHAAEIKQTMAGPDGKPMEINSRATFGLLQKTAASGDTVTVELTLDRLAGYMSFSESIKSAYDTDQPDDENASPDHKAAYEPIRDMPLKITLDSKGVATAVSGGEPIRQKLLALGEQNFVAKALADEDLSDRQIMSVFGEAPLILYPNREVRVGDTWTRVQHDSYPHVGKVIVTYDCKLDRIENAAAGDTAVVTFKGTITKDPDDKPAEGQRLGMIDGSFTGSARFDVASSRFAAMERETKSQVQIAPWWTKDPAAPMMKIDGQYKHRYSLASAADRTKQKTAIAQRVAAARAKAEAEEAAALAGPVDPMTPENSPVAWLQWGGPNRDFSSTATGLANSWPKGGPPKLWERPLGDGFSAILCDGKSVYTAYSVRDKADAFKGDEVIVALDAKTGKTLWEHRYAAPWPKDLQMEFGPGPHSTPIIVGNRIFAVGCTAKLFCLDTATGKEIWKHDLLEEFKAEMNMRGYGSSPLACKDTIVLPVSKEKGHAVIAFKQSDGAVAWKGGDFAPGYASLLEINVDGVQQLVAFTGTSVAGLDPTNGSQTWSVDHPTQWGANITTPLYSPSDKRLFISSAYGMGSRGVQLQKVGSQVTAKESWFNNKMKVQHADIVRVGDWVYGSSGDFGPAFLACMNAATGEFGWRQRGITKATVVAADGKLIVLDEDGTLYLVKADPTRYRLLGKATGIAAKTAWTVPTLYGRTLFVRDRSKVVALDLGAKAG